MWPAFIGRVLRGVGLAAAAFGIGGGGSVAVAQPVFTDWPVAAPLSVSAVAAAPLEGWYAVADTGNDTVEIRDIRGVLIRTIDAEELEGPVSGARRGFPGAEGPVALAFSDSGLQLFVALRTDLATDVVRRFDSGGTGMSTVAAVDLGQTNSATGVSMAFFRGRLYIASPGVLRDYRVPPPPSVPSLQNTYAFTGIEGIAIDRDQARLYVSLSGTVFRSPLSPVSLSPVGILGNVRALAWHDHFGSGTGSTGPGLFVATDGGSTLKRVPAAAARGESAFSAPTYTTSNPAIASLSAAADGGFIAVRGGAPTVLRDASDTRLLFEGWLSNEFAQNVAFARSLVTPTLAAGTPAGWVIDADVQVGWTRFHPATPDAAAWTVMLLLMNEHLNGDSGARVQVLNILNRYAGLAADGVVPSRSADGIYRHWIDPMTGGVKAGWSDEFATLSTMKIVHAAARAWARYPTDPAIEQAARAIICGVQNWDAYFRNNGSQVAFVGLAGGGPDQSSWSGGWHEGMIFAEEAGAYGGAGGDVARDRWTSRATWPTYAAGTYAITGSVNGQVLPAFITGYANVLSGAFRSDVLWGLHTRGLMVAHQGWTDDNGPRYATVFSAGTTAAVWGSYHADSLTDHPGDVTTFPSLMALAGRPQRAGESPVAGAVGAYQAYRRGARQTWRGNASLLYRRSQADLAYSPNSAGLPDVALGALGLAELIAPGSVAAVLASGGFTGAGYPSCGCPADRDGDGDVDSDAIVVFFASWEAGEGDVDGDEDSDSDDVVRFFERWDSGC